MKYHEKQKVKICVKHQTPFLFGEKYHLPACFQRKQGAQASFQVKPHWILRFRISPKKTLTKPLSETKRKAQRTAFANIAYNTHIYNPQQRKYMYWVKHMLYIYIYKVHMANRSYSSRRNKHHKEMKPPRK